MECDDSAKRSIEMTVALGDFDSNPIIPLLASKDTEIDNQTNDEREQDDNDGDEDQKRKTGDIISLSNVLSVGGGGKSREEAEG